MKRWLLILGGFAITVLVSLVASVAAALLTVQLSSPPDDDSPATGLFFFGVVLLYVGIAVPFSMALFAECMERRNSTPRGKWLRIARRFPFALIAGAGIIYLGWIGLFRAHWAEPHWQLKELVSVVAILLGSWLAFRIRQPHRDGQVS